MKIFYFTISYLARVAIDPISFGKFLSMFLPIYAKHSSKYETVMRLLNYVLD